MRHAPQQRAPKHGTTPVVGDGTVAVFVDVQLEPVTKYEVWYLVADVPYFATGLFYSGFVDLFRDVDARNGHHRGRIDGLIPTGILDNSEFNNNFSHKF